MAELVDAYASGAYGSKIPWRFKSSSGHILIRFNESWFDYIRGKQTGIMMILAGMAELVDAQS